jgi:hypothetical protein
MAIPNALTEGAGDKMLPLLYDDAGSNAAAAWRGVVMRVLNGSPVAYLGVGSHPDAGAWEAGDPVTVAGAVEGTTVRKLVADSSGRLIIRPLGAYDSGGTNVFGHPRLVAGAALNGEQVGWLGTATNADAAAFAASGGVVVGAGVDGSTVRKHVADTVGRLLVSDRLTFGGNGATTVSVTGTAVALRASTTCRRVQIRAHSGNANTLYIGTSGVLASTDATNGGYQLAGGGSVVIDVTNLDLVFVNGTAGQGCSYIWWL